MGFGAGSDHQRQRLVAQPAKGEHDGVERARVHPLGVVDDDEQRSRLGSDPEEPDRGGGHSEGVVGDGRTRRERRLEDGSLATGQSGDSRQRGAEQLVQPGKRQLGLHLEAGRPKHLKALQLCERRLQQRGLSHPRRPRDHHSHRMIAALGDRRQQPAEIPIAPDQPADVRPVRPQRLLLLVSTRHHPTRSMPDRRPLTGGPSPSLSSQPGFPSGACDDGEPRG